MPDIPGSGPTDPERILRAIADDPNADWRDNRLWIGNALWWLTVVDGRWELKSLFAHKIDRTSFLLLQEAATATSSPPAPSGYFFARGTLHELRTEKKGDGLWATAVPASTST